MSRPPLISVVVPVRNGEVHLAETIESVLGQTWRSLELLVVDDGSSDGSAAIAERHGDHRTRVLRQRPAGTGAARNAGLAAARGELIAHLDADDLWSEHKLERQAELLSHRPEVDLVGGLVAEFISPEVPASERARMRPPRGPLPGMIVQALLIRREAQDRVGGFETAWAAGQDLAWVMRAQEQLTFAYRQEVLVRRRLHATNKGRQSGALASQRCLIIKQALDRRRSAGMQDEPR